MNLFTVVDNLQGLEMFLDDISKGGRQAHINMPGVPDNR